MFILRQQSADIREAMTKAKDDISLNISSARGPYEEELLRAKLALESNLEQHDAQHEANVEQLEDRLRHLDYKVELSKLDKLACIYSEERANWLKRIDRDSDESATKLKECRRLIDAQNEVLDRHPQESAFRVAYDDSFR